MTNTEQAFKVADRYLHGGTKERQIILSCFTETKQKVFTGFIAVYKLFNDQRYYDAVKAAVCEQVKKELCMKMEKGYDEGDDE